MPNSSSKKAQFFILTTVVIVGVFYTLSKYINPYAFIDTSKAASGSETFFFDNVKEKTIKTLQISDLDELENNLENYKNYVKRMASEKGYQLAFDYVFGGDTINISMILMSQRYTLKADFTCDLISYIKVYDFKGITYPSSTHKAYRNCTSSLPNLDEGTQFTSSNYDAINEDDDSPYYYACLRTSGSPFRAWYQFRFLIDEPPSTINDITIFWKGWGSYETGASCTKSYKSNLYIWNFNSGSWELIDSHFSNTDQYIISSFTSSIDSYIDSATGYLYLLTTSDESDPLGCESEIQTDYVKLEVNSTQLVQWVCT